MQGFQAAPRQRPPALAQLEQVIGIAERVGDPVLAAVADEQDVGVLERRRAVRAATEAVAVVRIDPRSVPGSQCAPWMTHGTMCSRRQNVATRSPAGSAARKPSSRSTATPHQLQDSLTARKGTLREDGVASNPMSEPLTITVLEGDETGQELLDQALRVLDPDVLGLPLDLERFDLSLENRRATDNGVVDEAAAAMCRSGLGIKAATITPEGKDDVGSPNRLLREGIDGKVIIRTGRRIPGVTPPLGGVPTRSPSSAWRSATRTAPSSGARRRGRRRDRVPHRADLAQRRAAPTAEYAFRTATDGREGLRRAEVDGLARLRGDAQGGARRRRRTPPRRHYQPVLIDATYAGLISGVADMPLVIPALNRDGDCLSDLVMPMFGSIAGAESCCSRSTTTTRSTSRWPRRRTAPRRRCRARTSPTRWR